MLPSLELGARAVTMVTRAISRGQSKQLIHVTCSEAEPLVLADMSRERTLIFGGHLAEKEDRVSCNVEMYCYLHAQGY